MNNTLEKGCALGDNQVLSALPADERQRWGPYLEPVQLRSGQVLCEAGVMPLFVHFPTTAVVSLMSMTLDGDSAELALVGRDGVVGIAVFMGGDAMPAQAVVSCAGQALRMPTPVLKSLLQRAGPALGTLLCYTQALIAKVAQTALCNRYHSIEQQLSRRLLLGLDQTFSDELDMTQEQAAGLLGVRREGVTAAALRLQRSGLIRYQRGHIRVLDRLGLEQRACECYAAATQPQAWMLPRPRKAVLAVQAETAAA
jgi:CRP-like cAMP-binding protein